MLTLCTSPVVVSCSRRVRPSLSRKIRVAVFRAMRLPSLSTCTDSVTESAEYGAPGVMRDSTDARARSTTCFSTRRLRRNRLRAIDPLPCAGAASASAAKVIVILCCHVHLRPACLS